MNRITQCQSWLPTCYKASVEIYRFIKCQLVKKYFILVCKSELQAKTSYKTLFAEGIKKDIREKKPKKCKFSVRFHYIMKQYFNF